MLVNMNYQAYKFDPHHPLLKDPTDRATGMCVYLTDAKSVAQPRYHYDCQQRQLSADVCTCVMYSSAKYMGGIRERYCWELEANKRSATKVTFTAMHGVGTCS